MSNEKQKQLTPEQALSVLATRELERRKIIRDIEYFFENYMYIENKSGKTPDERSVLFKMFPEQKRVLKEIEENSKNILIKARQLGMTWLSLGYGTHGCLSTQQYTVAILSQTEEYMYAAIDRVEYILMRLPKWLMQEYNKQNAQYGSMYLYEKKSDEVIIYYPAREDGVRVTSTINGYVSTERSGRSITADLIILDEWAFHENAELVFAGIGPTINRPDSGKLIGLSTNKRGSYFESIVTDCLENNAEMGFHLIFLSVFADPRRTKEWYEQTKKTFKNTWRQEYPETIEQALSAGELTAFPEFSRDIHVCLHGDTLIDTIEGQKYIKDLVGTTGSVFSFDCENNVKVKKRYYDVRKTKEIEQIFEIELEDGRKFKATKYHPMLTQRGWVKICNLTDEDFIVDVED